MAVSAHGEWIVRTRVEKWCDLAVSRRCKLRGLRLGPNLESATVYDENATTCHTIS